MTNEQIIYKRLLYNVTLQLRIANQEEVENLKTRLSYFDDIKSRILLDEKIKYDQELKSQLIELDSEINYATWLKHL